MSWIKRLLNITTDKSIQEKSRNKAVLECLRALEFGAVEIRQALVGLNRVKVKDLAKIDGVSAVTIYNTIKGRRTSPKAQELIAQSLNLSVEDLFPKEVEPKTCEPSAPDPQPQ